MITALAWFGLSMSLAGTVIVEGGTLFDQGQHDLVIVDEVIAAVGLDGYAGDVSEAMRLDATDKCIAPGVIDSHVHLALAPLGEQMADGGVAAAIDMAAPFDYLSALPTRPLVKSTGPMITAVKGYPTQTWGKDGYGWQVFGRKDVRARVEQNADAGAVAIKIPFTRSPQLTGAELRTAVDVAHARGLKVVAHALDDTLAARAADAGCDVLAHTPTDRLSDATVSKWADKAVISTLQAFGATDTAVDNLRRLKAAGATVLYGTDFGNSNVVGVNEQEMALMAKAGMSREEIRASATTVPAAFWGLERYGRIEVGMPGIVWIGPCD